MKLSDKEWRVLNALWVAPEGLALGAVVDALRPDTGWSRSTVLTYLTRMRRSAGACWSGPTRARRANWWPPF